MNGCAYDIGCLNMTGYRINVYKKSMPMWACFSFSNVILIMPQLRAIQIRLNGPYDPS